MLPISFLLSQLGDSKRCKRCFHRPQFHLKVWLKLYFIEDELFCSRFCCNFYIEKKTSHVVRDLK